MIAAILKRINLAMLQRAIKRVERAGLAIVQVKKGEGCVYLVGSSGQYVRFDRVKSGKTPVRQDEKPCRVNPLYSGPSNCNLGTVGCTIPEHRVKK